MEVVLVTIKVVSFEVNEDFYDYLTTLSVAQIMQQRMTGDRKSVV
jgi:hypothetical protein